MPNDGGKRVSETKCSESDLTGLLCCCEHCNDGEGNCAYPIYGLSPHKHIGEQMIGSTVIDDKETWPDNFQEGPEAPGCGTWTHCLSCGRPNYQDQETKRLRESKAT